MTVLIHVNTSKQVGDLEHLKVFANVDAAETWFKENDPEGVARCDRMTSWRKSLRQITQRNIHRCPGRGTIGEATSSDIAAGEIVSAAQRAMATSGPGVSYSIVLSARKRIEGGISIDSGLRVSDRG